MRHRKHHAALRTVLLGEDAAVLSYGRLSTRRLRRTLALPPARAPSEDRTR